jgi:hypothetical protein
MKYKKYLFFTFIAVIIVDITRYLSWVGYKLNGEMSTYVSTFLIYVSTFILINFSIKSHWEKETPSSIKKILIWWFVINIINLIRGGFLSVNYWDYKFLFLNGISYFIITLLFFVGNSLIYVNIIFKYSFKFLFPLGFLLIPLTLMTNEELYSRIMIPISLFILFIPYIKVKNIILILIIIIVSIFLVIGFRSNIIKIILSVLLLFSFYLNINKNFINIINIMFFVVPLILLSLAITGTFNIFKYISKEKKYELVTNENTNETSTGETRTFLYVEVLNYINSKGNFLIGGVDVAEFIQKAIKLLRLSYN